MMYLPVWLFTCPGSSLNRKKHFCTEYLHGGIVGEFLLHQGKSISQDIEIWVQVLQVEY